MACASTYIGCQVWIPYDDRSDANYSVLSTRLQLLKGCVYSAGGYQIDDDNSRSINLI